METRPKTHGMEPERSSSIARSLHLRRMLATLGACALGVGFYLAVGPSLGCQKGQRPRDEAVGLAMQFARDTFLGRSRNYTLKQLVERDVQYDDATRRWQMSIASNDDVCSVEVAVPDCARPRLVNEAGECTSNVVNVDITIAP